MKLLDWFDSNSNCLWLTLATSLLVACGSGGQGPILGTDGSKTRPTIIVTSPTKSNPIVTDVAINLGLSAQFSRAMSASTINTDSFKVNCPSGTAMTGVVTYDAVNHIAIWSHTVDFPANTLCEATISKAALDTNGLSMLAEYSWTFQTGTTSETTAPTVIGNSPVNAATGICLTKSITINFSEPVSLT